jgi:hypothetical protein
MWPARAASSKIRPLGKFTASPEFPGTGQLRRRLEHTIRGLRRENFSWNIEIQAQISSVQRAPKRAPTD